MRQWCPSSAARSSKYGLRLQKPRLPAITFGAHSAAVAYSQSQYTPPLPMLTTAHHGAGPYSALATAGSARSAVMTADVSKAVRNTAGNSRVGRSGEAAGVILTPPAGARLRKVPQKAVRNQAAAPKEDGIGGVRSRRWRRRRDTNRQARPLTHPRRRSKMPLENSVLCSLPSSFAHLRSPE